MSTFIAKIRAFLSTILLTCAASMMALICVIVFINAFSRYVFNSGFAWGEEAAVFAMIFGVMFGSAAAFLNDNHVKFSVILDLFPDKVNFWLARLADLLMVIIGVALTYSGYLFTLRRGKIDSPAIGLEMAYFQSAIIVGGALLVIVGLFKLCEQYFALQESK